MHRSTARRLGVALTALSLSLGLATAAHAAEPDLTVKGRVVDAQGVGVSKISVYAISDTDLAKLDSEDDEGEDDDFGDWEIVQLKTTPSGRFSLTDGRLTTEGWNFAFVDDRDVAQPFALTELHQTLSDPETDLGDVTLRPGAVISGVLTTAVTGTPVYDVALFASTADSPDYSDDFAGLDLTGKTGAFRFAGLEAGTYGIYAFFDVDDDFPRKPTKTIRVTEGQSVSAALTTKVPCRRSFTATSKKGKVTFRAAAYDPDNRVYSPQGKVTITRGSKTVKTLTLPKKGHAVTVTLAQAKGKKTYTASYSGGDCRNWTFKRTITVR